MPPSSSLNAFDLPGLVEKMKLRETWAVGDNNEMILLKSPGKQIVLTAFHKGIKIKSLQTNDSITFQILEGRIKLRTRKEEVTLEKGQLVALHENTEFSLTTKQETVLLLTIANGAMDLAGTEEPIQMA